MQLSKETIGPLLRQSITDPAGVARILTQTRYDRGTLWSALALVTVLSVLMLAASQLIFPVPVPQEAVGITPWTYAMILGASLVTLVFALYFTGRMLGGTGHFPETLLLVVWFQVLAMALQVVQLVVMLIFPPLSAILSLLGMGWLFFCLMHFINVLHGFDNLFKALATFFIAVVGLGFGLALILTLIGVTVQAGVV